MFLMFVFQGVLQLVKKYTLFLEVLRGVKNNPLGTHRMFFVWQYLLMENIW